MPPEEDEATITGDLYRKSGEFRPYKFRQADRQTRTETIFRSASKSVGLTVKGQDM